MPHQGYQILYGSSGVPLLDKKQYWIRRQTGSAGTTMTDGTTHNGYHAGNLSDDFGYTEQHQTPSSGTMSTNNWSFSTSDDNCDVITVSLSHSNPGAGAQKWQLNALSLGTVTNAIVYTTVNPEMIIVEGGTTGGTVKYQKSFGAYGMAFWGVHPSDPSSMWSRPNGATSYALWSTGDSSESIPLLDYDQEYTVGWGWNQLGSNAMTARSGGNFVSSRTITTDSGTITATFSTSTVNGTLPFDATNSTTVSAGQIPIIGIYAN